MGAEGFGYRITETFSRLVPDVLQSPAHVLDAGHVHSDESGPKPLCFDEVGSYPTPDGLDAALVVGGCRLNCYPLDFDCCGGHGDFSLEYGALSDSDEIVDTCSRRSCAAFLVIE